MVERTTDSVRVLMEGNAKREINTAPSPHGPAKRDARALARPQSQACISSAVNLKLVRQGDSLQIILDHPGQVTGQAHLMAALGITDLTLAISILDNLGDLAKRRRGISQFELNSLLSMVRGIGPRDPLEAMLAVQMAAIHSATIVAAATMKRTETIEQQDSASNSLNKLARTFAAQVEALKRHRSAGEQTVNVKHVHVHAGGQAVVGHVAGRGEGDGKTDHQSHGLGQAAPTGSADAPGSKVRGDVEADGTVVPLSGGAREERVPVSRGTRWRS